MNFLTSRECSGYQEGSLSDITVREGATAMKEGWSALTVEEGVSYNESSLFRGRRRTGCNEKGSEMRPTA